MNVEKKIFIETYGCQMNVYDSKRILQLASEKGFRKTENPATADLIILNTCSVREKPEKKTFSALGRYKALKKKNENLKIGVCGCVAKQCGEELLNECSILDFVLSPDNINELPSVIDEIYEKQRVCKTAFKKRNEWEFLKIDPKIEEKPTAFLTVIRGCNKVCSFCIVPYVRGVEISKPPELVIDEIKSLVSYGIKEVTLLGQNITAYGRDLSPKTTFSELLLLVNEIEGLERIRFVTSHPSDCDDELFKKFRELPKLCEYFHLPVQSGSDKILEKMRRGYTKKEYMEKIKSVRKYCPEIALTTDIIVGFPSEGEEDFNETMKLLQDVEFDQIFSFKYSPRPRTSALKFGDDVPLEEKKRRLYEVQKLQNEISRRKMQKYLNNVYEVLAEGESPRGTNNNNTMFYGRTRTNVIVHFPFQNLINKGSLVKVLVKEILPHSLKGELV